MAKETKKTTNRKPLSTAQAHKLRSLLTDKARGTKGLTYEVIAARVGCSRPTVYNWAKKSLCTTLRTPKEFVAVPVVDTPASAPNTFEEWIAYGIDHNWVKLGPSLAE